MAFHEGLWPCGAGLAFVGRYVCMAGLHTLTEEYPDMLGVQNLPCESGDCSLRTSHKIWLTAKRCMQRLRKKGTDPIFDWLP